MTKNIPCTWTKHKQTGVHCAQCRVKHETSYMHKKEKVWAVLNSYGASLATWDHTVSPATQHPWMHPTLTPVRQFTNPGGMKGRWPCWLIICSDCLPVRRRQWPDHESNLWPLDHKSSALTITLNTSQTYDLLTTSPVPQRLHYQQCRWFSPSAHPLIWQSCHFSIPP